MVHFLFLYTVLFQSRAEGGLLSDMVRLRDENPEQSLKRRWPIALKYSRRKLDLSVTR